MFRPAALVFLCVREAVAARTPASVLGGYLRGGLSGQLDRFKTFAETRKVP
jgi:hypothetical protein